MSSSVDMMRCQAHHVDRLLPDAVICSYGRSLHVTRRVRSFAGDALWYRAVRINIELNERFVMKQTIDEMLNSSPPVQSSPVSSHQSSSCTTYYTFTRRNTRRMINRKSNLTKEERMGTSTSNAITRLRNRCTDAGWKWTANQNIILQ